MSSGSFETAAQGSRTVVIEARDASGARAAGTEVHIEAKGAPLGTVTVGASAVILHFVDDTAILRITGRFWGETLTALLPPGVNEHRFNFRAVSRGVYAGPGTARCPDGTVGQPCVDCNIKGTVIRICA